MGVTLPIGWKMVKLGEVCEVVSGFGFPLDLQGDSSGDIPFYKVSDMNLCGNEKHMIYHNNSLSSAKVLNLRYKIYPLRTIIFPKIGAAIATNKKRLLTKPSLFDNNVMGLIPGESIEVMYLYYWLQALNISVWASDSQPPSIRKPTVENHLIPLPPLDTQRKIVHILDSADNLRELRKQADDKMMELVPALLDEMFGDPFGNERKWPVRSLEDIALDVQYGTSAKANEIDEGIPVLRMNNLRYDGSLDLKDLKHTVLQDDEFDKYTVQYGDVLINRTNSRELVGKTAVWDKDYTYAFAGYLVRFRLDAKLANPFYVSSALNLPSGKKLLFSMAKPAVNMSNISASDMKRIRLAIPPVELQDKFAEQAREVASNQEVISEARKKLDDLFNSLMDRCMSGQI
jgi:type I restriction enzyme S subunit